MKTWLTYPVAALLGLATTLLAGNSPLFAQAAMSVTNFVAQVGFCIILMVMLFSFPAGIASLRRDNKLSGEVKAIVGWTLATTILLPLAATALYSFFPAALPVTSTTGGDPALLDTLGRSAKGILPVLQFGFPAILISSLLLGYFMKPDMELARPAYVTLNSLSEVVYRMLRSVTRAGAIYVYLCSAALFSALWLEGSVFAAPRFLYLLIAEVALFTLVLLPLLYTVFTKGKSNPYRIIYRSIAPALTGLFTGNILLSELVAIPVSRHNLGTQKRVSSTAIPLMALISRGGTAALSTTLILSMITAAGGSFDLSVALLVALISSLCSFASPLALGYEVVIISSMALKTLQIESWGVMVTLIGLLPLLNGIAIMLDTLVVEMGSAYIAHSLDVAIINPYQDII